jgi:hypothetical protein
MTDSVLVFAPGRHNFAHVEGPSGQRILRLPAGRADDPRPAGSKAAAGGLVAGTSAAVELFLLAPPS